MQDIPLALCTEWLEITHHQAHVCLSLEEERKVPFLIRDGWSEAVNDFRNIWTADWYTIVGIDFTIIFSVLVGLILIFHVAGSYCNVAEC